MLFDLTSAGLLPASFAFRSSRAAFRPSAVPNSATSALMSGLDAGSIFACATILPAAKLSWSSPQSPLGSAAVTAMPAIIMLSSSTLHSSGVKFDLSAIGVAPMLVIILRVRPQPECEGSSASDNGTSLPFVLQERCTCVQSGPLHLSANTISERLERLY